MSMIIHQMVDYINILLHQQSKARGVKFQALHDKECALLIAEAEKEIQTKLKIINTNYNLNISDSADEYLLPTDVGDVDYVKMQEKFVDAVFQIENRSDGKYIVFTSKGTERVNFYVYYFPVIDNYTSDLKRYDEVKANKPTLTLPDDAKTVIAWHVLKTVMPDLEGIYNQKIKEFRATLSPVFDSTTNYNIGNLGAETRI